MKRGELSCGVLLLLFSFSPYCDEAKAQSAAAITVHIDGEKALTLISLLASGSNDAKAMFEKQGRLVVHDLAVVEQSTHKYDPDQPLFKLGLYHATAKIADARNASEIGEANSLYKFLSSLGIDPNDLALEGSYRDASLIDCRVDVKADFSTPNRFQCDITAPR